MDAGGEGVCIVYSKRTARLVNSVELTPDGKMANAMPGVAQNLDAMLKQRFDNRPVVSDRGDEGSALEDALALLVRERLTGRGQDDPATIDRRMAAAVSEMSHYVESDYLVVNDDFDRAVADLRALVTSQRLQTRAQSQRLAATLQALLGPGSADGNFAL